ncbi:MAG: hypothetical protein ABFS09_12390 [Thermodesulfobacteriota bacterium]
MELTLLEKYGALLEAMTFYFNQGVDGVILQHLYKARNAGSFQLSHKGVHIGELGH